jgi:hypothetical protein
VIACGGIGVGEALAVGESDVKTIGAEDEVELLGIGDGSGVGETVGLGNSVGVGSAVGSGVATGASTVPKIGAKRSSASERGATINRQRTTSAMMAFFIVDSGVLAMSARVMKLAQTIIFSRVLPEQIEYLVPAPW